METLVLQSNINNITEICKNENETSNINCNYFEKYIEHNINKLREEKRKLFPEKRLKRDTWSIFKTIKDFLPCICSFATNPIEDVLKLIEANRNFTTELIKLNNDALLIYKNYTNQLSDNIISIYKKLGKIENDYANLKKENFLNNIILLTIHTIDEHLIKTNKILNILHNQQILEITDLISLEDINKTIQELEIFLLPNEQFIYNNPLDIITNAILSTQINETEIKIELKIPVELKNSQLELYKIIPIPFEGKESKEQLKIETFNSYILHNNFRTITIDHFGVQSCVKITDNKLLCDIEEIAKDNNECEVPIFLKKLPKLCIVKRIEADAYIIRVTLNKFYCIVNNKLKFTTSCNGINRSYEITNNTWFQVDYNCVLNFTHRVFYIPKENNQKELEIRFPGIRTSDINIKQIFNNLTYNDPDTLIIERHTTFMKDINAQINNVSRDLNKLHNKTTIKPVLTENSTGTIICTIIFVVICVAIIRCCVTCLCGKS